MLPFCVPLDNFQKSNYSHLLELIKSRHLQAFLHSSLPVLDNGILNGLPSDRIDTDIFPDCLNQVGVHPIVALL